MSADDSSTPKKNAVSRIIDRLSITLPGSGSGSGITVIVNGVHRVGGEFLDEIAAAIIAIKMYIRSKNSKRKSRKALNQEYKKNYNNGRNMLWFKSWLKEVMKEFDFNPYRRGIAKNNFHGL